MIERSTSDDKPLGIAKLSEDVIFDMNPAILEVLRIRPSNYEIQVESWPLPNFVRISPVAECDNQCIIYKLVNGRWENDTVTQMDTCDWLNISYQIKPIFVEIIYEIFVKTQTNGGKFFEISLLGK